MQVARVTLNGNLNSIPFVISRTKTATKSGLTFVYDGQDVTAQSVKETQICISEKLCITPQILTRMIFHGQYGLNNLLEMTDTKLKEELSLIVPIDIWQDAATYSRKMARDSSNEMNKLDGMISLRSSDLDHLREQLKALELAYDDKAKTYDETYAALEHDMISTSYDMNTKDSHSYDQSNDDIAMLQETMNKAMDEIKSLELQKSSIVDNRDKEINLQHVFKQELTKSTSGHTNQLYGLQLKERELLTQKELAITRIESIQKAWNIDLMTAMDVPDFIILPSNCPTCGQSVDSLGANTDGKHLHEHDDHRDHHHHQLEEKVRTECEDAIANWKSIDVKSNDINQEIDQVKIKLLHYERQLEQAQHDYDVVRTKWDDELHEVDDQLSYSRETYSRSSERLTGAAHKIQEQSKVLQWNTTINFEKESLNKLKHDVDRIRKEMEICQYRIDDFNTKKHEKWKLSNMMSKLSDAFGPRGIQTFVLHNTIRSLEVSAQSYLDELSDGTQRLQIQLNDQDDRIVRRAYIRSHHDGSYKERPLASLSGGQLKRCSVALSLAFSDVVSRRGKFRTSLCIMDEPLTHLDQNGRADFGRVLRGLLSSSPSTTVNQNEDNESMMSSLIRKHAMDQTTSKSLSTIVIILQDLAAQELEESFDAIDEVVRENGSSQVKINV